MNETPEDLEAIFHNISESYVCRKPSTLFKKPSASSENAFWFSKEAF